MRSEYTIRKTTAADTALVMDIIRRTKFFRPVEETIAQEVLDDAIADASYQSYVIEKDGHVAGWICFGVTPCTLGTFDIYWIAVDPDIQHAGLGSGLLTFAEQQIAAQGGRLMVIETSGSEMYRPTQRFYEKNGYRLAACVDDFYAPDDPKLIFTKQI
ncbi:MAG: GNAT family N-acetyltransferase [Phycisphaerae bacterium]|nr:GNAT family N-acetyltransferase [Phycisphaerae bacterium]